MCVCVCAFGVCDVTVARVVCACVRACTGRRNYGHGPPATPLVPFNSKLSQDFLDLFAHSVPSPRKP